MILDASVVLKWFIDEEGSDKARKIQDDFIAGSSALTVPDLLLYEITNALRFNRTFKEQDIEEVLNALSQMGLETFPVNYQVIKSAVKLAYNFNITVYDAIYAGLAFELFVDFVTADKELYKKLNDFPRVKLL